MIKKRWFGACHATTAMMYAFSKKICIEAIPCIGECEQKEYKPFDHSWILIDSGIYDIAIAMPFISKMARGPVYNSIDIRTNEPIDIIYGKFFIGLGDQATFAYNQSLYDYLKGSKNINLIKTMIELA